MPIRRSPPRDVRSAVRRGLRLYDQGNGGDGLKPETIRRARSIAEGAEQSIQWITVEAPAWFARHTATRPEGDVSGTPWEVAWLLWGGDAGRAWTQREQDRRARMEAAGETIMAMTIPTVEGQTLGDFLEELRSAAAERLLGMAGDSPLSLYIEDDSVTETDVIVEVCGLPDGDKYYRLQYSRDPSGRLIVSEPAEVTEVTTFQPVSATLARGLVLESLRVHAPPAVGLTRGRRVQLLRVGPLYDAYTGSSLLDITDSLCSQIASSAAALGYGIPIDMGHSLYHAAADEAPVLYGRIVELEAVPGAGLYGVPEWTDAGRALLASQPGLYYLSPTMLGTPRDPRTGAEMPGRILHSVSLTATPRQDSLESLALSRAVSGANTPRGDAIMAQPQSPTGGDLLTLTRERDTLLGQVDTLTRERDAIALERDTYRAQVEQSEQLTHTLSARVEALETAAARARAAAEVDAAELAGKVITPDARVALLSMAAEHRTMVLSHIPVTRPVRVIGHAASVDTDPKAAEAAAVNDKLSTLRKVK